MTLCYDSSGDGPALVLLHSAVCDRHMWAPQWPALRDAGYYVVWCDFRGFGDSPVADRPYRDAADVADLLDHLGLERVALVGSSHGGEVALEVAATRPEAVTAVALLCSAMPGHVPGPELRSFTERKNALLAAGNIAGAVELNVTTWLGPEASGEVREQVRQMCRHAVETHAAAKFASTAAPVDLARITAPCLAVSGAHDLADFREIAVGLPERIAGARHLELPWAGHLPSLERPAVVTDLLIRFLGETVPAG
ncbi:alpha/beta fold hydrolase [Nonomuraea longispora]|uniref:Alpha/beta fold hydrolase n=2 Tax=Nonomuraea longispora TaxID=1848320 RepID=A0A4R4N358_9ACTN|nr:alpha/beta hydrolase [Nonomuraea longispora]TDC03181.1 alpha/beta fold hydrolase [Nonomuraea longispora]